VSAEKRIDSIIRFETNPDDRRPSGNWFHHFENFTPPMMCFWLTFAMLLLINENGIRKSRARRALKSKPRPEKVARSTLVALCEIIFNHSEPYVQILGMLTRMSAIGDVFKPHKPESHEGFVKLQKTSRSCNRKIIKIRFVIRPAWASSRKAEKYLISTPRPDEVEVRFLQNFFKQKSGMSFLFKSAFVQSGHSRAEEEIRNSTRTFEDSI
jgi:hypothetical protein